MHHLTAIVLAFVFLSCSIEPSNKRTRKRKDLSDSAPTTSEKKDEDQQRGSVSGLSSLAAFKITVYPLVREQTCGGCHDKTATPFFASDDPIEAHVAVIEGKKVSFDSPEQSRLVLRLSEDNHNCWSECDSDAKEMLGAINRWIDSIETPQIDEADNALKTDSLRLSDAIEKSSDSQDETAFIFEAEQGDLMQPMNLQTNEQASAGEFILTPNGNGGLLQPNNTLAGIARYEFELDRSGRYRLWGRVNTPTAADNSIYVSIDGGAYLSWRMMVTGADWDWDMASDQDAGGNIHEFNLNAGRHTLELRQREDGTGIDQLALSDDPNFNGESNSTKSQAKVLQYDLADILGGESLLFEIEVSRFDQFSYKFKNPAIRNNKKAVFVKGLRILVNGQSDPENATYSVIEQTVEPGGGVLSSSAMIVNTKSGFDSDQIAISFETLELR